MLDGTTVLLFVTDFHSVPGIHYSFSSLFFFFLYPFLPILGEAAASEVFRRDQPGHGQVLLHGGRHAQGARPGRSGDAHRVGQPRYKQVSSPPCQAGFNEVSQIDQIDHDLL